jgi:hypothetical protein
MVIKKGNITVNVVSIPNQATVLLTLLQEQRPKEVGTTCTVRWQNSNHKNISGEKN